MKAVNRPCTSAYACKAALESTYLNFSITNQLWNEALGLVAASRMSRLSQSQCRQITLGWNLFLTVSCITGKSTETCFKLEPIAKPLGIFSFFAFKMSKSANFFSRFAWKQSNTGFCFVCAGCVLIKSKLKFMS